jgi:predicted transcriptional regulator
MDSKMKSDHYLILCLIRHRYGSLKTVEIAGLIKLSHKGTQQLIVDLYNRGLIVNIQRPILTELGERVASGHYLIFVGGQVKVGELVRVL